MSAKWKMLPTVYTRFIQDFYSTWLEKFLSFFFFKFRCQYSSLYQLGLNSGLFPCPFNSTKRQNICKWKKQKKNEIWSGKGRKHSGKRRKCWLPAFSPFPTMFSKGFFFKVNWLIVWCLTPFSTVFQLYCCSQCTYPCFPGVLLTSSPHNILSKPLAAFPHNHCRNNGQRWERNESCRNDYHQSSERILAEPGIEPATSRSQVGNSTGLSFIFSRLLTLYFICQV